MQRYLLPQAFHIRYANIHEEHEALLELLNEMKSGGMHEEPGSIRSATDRFLDSLATHFANEERLMAEARYPRYEEHRSHHQECLALASTILGGDADGAQYPGKATLDRIFDLLVNTVARVDLYFEEYLIGCGRLPDRPKAV